MFNKSVWKNGESQVVDYMKNKGYKIVYNNYSQKICELDIVAVLSKKVQICSIKNRNKSKIKDLTDKLQIKMEKYALKNQIKNLKNLLIIVEVKSRSNNKFGMGIDAISNKKILHMKRGAEILLKEKRFNDMQVRFDVASVDGGVLTYIENAFW